MSRRFVAVILVFIFLLNGLYVTSVNSWPKEDDASKHNVAKDRGEGDFVLLKSRKFKPEHGLDSGLEKKIQQKTSGGRIHVLLQLEKIPTDEEKRLLESEGIRLISYIPTKTWIASVPIDAVGEIIKLPIVRWVGELKSDDKISPHIRERGVGKWAKKADGSVDLNVVFSPDASREEIIGEIKKIGALRGEPAGDVLPVRIPEDYITQLALIDGVYWIEEEHPPLRTLNDGARNATGVDLLQSPTYNLTGAGVVLTEWDEGWVDYTHDDLAGRVSIGDSGSSIQDHATHVAGTMIGNGSINTLRKGMAPNATLISYEWPETYFELTNETNNAITNYSAVLSQNSWGYYENLSDCTPLGDYNIFSTYYDFIVRGNTNLVASPIVVVFSAGNERSTTAPYCGNINYIYNTTIGPGGTAKNTISVGAVNSNDFSMTTFSSWGPTDDGRIKPDLVAPGCQVGGDGGINSTNLNDNYSIMCGTSMAAPVVSGIVALIHEEYRSLYNGSNPLPATVKAILIQTAKDLNETGPDYTTGWGVVNATAAIDLLQLDNGTANFIIEGNVSAGGNTSFNITVPPGKEFFKATLVWDDYPGDPNAGKMLVNDLDLQVYYPNGTVVLPWVLNPANPSQPATKGVDDTNNVEQVVVNSPVAGNYLVVINGTSVPYGPQNFSLVRSEKLDETPPALTITAPQNSIYIATSLDLNVSASEPISTWLYSLNGAANVTFTPNTTMTNLAEGLNNITVYALDIGDNLNSSTVWFTVFYSIRNVNKGVNYSTIQGAINDANANDTILVLAGKYSENVVINESINLIGGGGNTTITPANASVPIFNVTANNSNVSNFSLSGVSGNSAIALEGANYTGISNCTISNSQKGISLRNSSNNTIANNIFYNNTYGIFAESLAGSLIYHNNFVNNTNQAYDNGTNTWDNGYPSGGNFWSNWTSPDLNYDGVVDYPYYISGSIKDRYPVAAQNGWLSITPDLTPPFINFTSPTDANNSNVSRNWTFVNVTVNETAIAVLLEWNGTNESMLNSTGTNWYLNKTVNDSTYSYRVWANDSVGLWNVSETRAVTIDTTLPSAANLTLNPQTPLTFAIVNITVNITDLHLDAVVANITWPNATLSSYKMTAASAGLYYYKFNATSFGTYYVRIIANDSAGNVNSTVNSSFWATEALSGNTNITNGTSQIVINGTMIKVNVTANESSNATVTLNATLASAAEVFGALAVTNSTSAADRGVRFSEITNATSLENVSKIRIELYYADANTSRILESSLALYYWNGIKWLSTVSYRGNNITNSTFVYDAGVNTTNDYVWAELNHLSVYGVAGLTDTDGDGIPDNSDSCPLENETVNGYADSDGCPDSAPTFSGGGGGGGAVPLTTKVTIDASKAVITIPSITVGTTETVTVPAAQDVQITEIGITAKNTVSSAKITADTLNSKPTEITENIGGVVYRYVSVATENIRDADIAKCVIKFKVEKAWIANSKIDPTKIVLNRYSGGGWNALPTTKLSEDSSNVYYSAESPGFSVFAISGSVIVVPTTAPPTTTPLPTTLPSETPPSTTSAPTSTVPPTTAPPETPAPNIYAPQKNEAILVIVVLLVAAYVLIKRKIIDIKKSKEETKK